MFSSKEILYHVSMTLALLNIGGSAALLFKNEISLAGFAVCVVLGYLCYYVALSVFLEIRNEVVLIG